MDDKIVIDFDSDEPAHEHDEPASAEKHRKLAQAILTLERECERMSKEKESSRLNEQIQEMRRRIAEKEAEKKKVAAQLVAASRATPSAAAPSAPSGPTAPASKPNNAAPEPTPTPSTQAGQPVKSGKVGELPPPPPPAARTQQAEQAHHALQLHHAQQMQRAQNFPQLNNGAAPLTAEQQQWQQWQLHQQQQAMMYSSPYTMRQQSYPVYPPQHMHPGMMMMQGGLGAGAAGSPPPAPVPKIVHVHGGKRPLPPAPAAAEKASSDPAPPAKKKKGGKAQAMQPGKPNAAALTALLPGSGGNNEPLAVPAAAKSVPSATTVPEPSAASAVEEQQLLAKREALVGMLKSTQTVGDLLHSADGTKQTGRKDSATVQAAGLDATGVGLIIAQRQAELAAIEREARERITARLVEASAQYVYSQEAVSNPEPIYLQHLEEVDAERGREIAALIAGLGPHAGSVLALVVGRRSPAREGRHPTQSQRPGSMGHSSGPPSPADRVDMTVGELPSAVIRAVFAALRHLSVSNREITFQDMEKKLEYNGSGASHAELSKLKLTLRKVCAVLEKEGYLRMEFDDGEWIVNPLRTSRRIEAEVLAGGSGKKSAVDQATAKAVVHDLALKRSSGGHAKEKDAAVNAVQRRSSVPSKPAEEVPPLPPPLPPLPPLQPPLPPLPPGDPPQTGQPFATAAAQRSEPSQPVEDIPPPPPPQPPLPPVPPVPPATTAAKTLANTPPAPQSSVPCTAPGTPQVDTSLGPLREGLDPDWPLCRVGIHSECKDLACPLQTWRDIERRVSAEGRVAISVVRYAAVDGNIPCWEEEQSTPPLRLLLPGQKAPSEKSSGAQSDHSMERPFSSVLLASVPPAPPAAVAKRNALEEVALRIGMEMPGWELLIPGVFCLGEHSGQGLGIVPTSANLAEAAKLIKRSPWLWVAAALASAKEALDAAPEATGHATPRETTAREAALLVLKQGMEFAPSSSILWPFYLRVFLKREGTPEETATAMINAAVEYAPVYYVWLAAAEAAPTAERAAGLLHRGAAAEIAAANARGVGSVAQSTALVNTLLDLELRALQELCRSGNDAALAAWVEVWVDAAAALPALNPSEAKNLKALLQRAGQPTPHSALSDVLRILGTRPAKLCAFWLAFAHAAAYSFLPPQVEHRLGYNQALLPITWDLTIPAPNVPRVAKVLETAASFLGVRFLPADGSLPAGVAASFPSTCVMTTLHAFWKATGVVVHVQGEPSGGNPLPAAVPAAVEDFWEDMDLERGPEQGTSAPTSKQQPTTTTTASSTEVLGRGGAPGALPYAETDFTNAEDLLASMRREHVIQPLRWPPLDPPLKRNNKMLQLGAPTMENKAWKEAAVKLALEPPSLRGTPQTVVEPNVMQALLRAVPAAPREQLPALLEGGLKVVQGTPDAATLALAVAHRLAALAERALWRDPGVSWALPCLASALLESAPPAAPWLWLQAVRFTAAVSPSAALELATAARAAHPKDNKLHEQMNQACS